MKGQSPSYSRLSQAVLVVVLMATSLMPQTGALLAQEPGVDSQDGARIEIEPGLLEQLDTDETAGYLIYFHDRPDLSSAYKMDWHERGWYVMKALQETADRSQARVRAYLDDQHANYRAFWIDNVIVVEGSDRTTFDGLTSFSEIDALRARRMMQVYEPVHEGEAASPALLAIEPNLTHVKVDQVWAMGYHGEGMVVANIDTGVRYTHEVLEPHYRGNLGGGSFDHDYNWLGAASGSSTPVDDHGHGSHTMGTMIGDDGGTNQVGMAPGAQWIACDGCQSIGCTDTALLTCAQWIAAPYPIGDPSSPNPDMRPHVVNNSWGDCGRSYNNWYQGSVNSWHAAGIYPVFSNGNASNCGYSQPPGCNTVGNPARYGNVTGVGSTGQQNGQYATHSNWGPTDNADTVNPRGYPSLKPQVLAPGVNIRSSLNGSDSDYGSWGGTSMSAPHVSALVALLWQACPDLVGDYATTETVLETTATPISYSSGCGGEGPGNIPNHATGWGEIDALAAVNEALNQCTPDFSMAATPETLDVCAPQDALYNVAVGQIGGFGDPVSLSTSGRPGGTTESFSINPVTPPGTSVLTIGDTGNAIVGSYGIDVTGTSGATVHNDTVALNLYDAPPGTPTLNAPADGSTDQSATPTFTWSAPAQAGTYQMEIATDPGFNNIVDSASGLTSATYTPGTALNSDTVHYWHVRATNACGTGNDSATWAFRTEALSCTTYGPGESGTIRDAGIFGPRTSSFDLDIPDSRTIIDLNVLDLIGTHSYVSDLDFALDSPAGTRLALIPRMCGSDDNFDKDLDDEAANPLTCPLNDGATQRPTESLSGYDGENSSGTWTLRVTDNAFVYSGSLSSWYLEVCSRGAATQADYSDLDSGFGVAWHAGDGSFRLGDTWTADDSFGPAGRDDASDDGVTFIGAFQAGQQATVRVNVQGTPANGRWLRGWFDWNGDGIFGDIGDGERVYNGNVNDGDNDILLGIPAGLTAPVNYRFRLYDSANEPTGTMAQDTGSYGGAAGGEVEDGNSPAPTVVDLARFEATPTDGAIRIEWETATEIDVLGFNLYRAVGAPEGERIRLNADLIPSKAPGSPIGAVYTWLDESIAPDTTYYYWLEDVDRYGVATIHGPVSATTAQSPSHRVYLPLVAR